MIVKTTPQELLDFHEGRGPDPAVKQREREMLGTTVTLTRDVTRDECPWLPRDLKKGEVLVKYLGHDYGVVSDDGLAVTEGEGGPFFEVPKDSLDSGVCKLCNTMTGFDTVDKKIYHDNGHVWPGFAGEPDGGNYGGSDF